MSDRRKTLFSALVSVHNWADLQEKWSLFTAKEKGDRFEELTQAYLQTAPEYLTKLKHVWRLEEVPVNISKKLNLPATDKGIDLVAETHEGEFWAIQCKYRQETNQQLTHTDISTFTSLTFQACKGFSFALVCSTTERVTSLYRDEERIGFCALDVWQEIDREFFATLRNKLTDKVVKLEPRTKRPHQIAAVKDGVEHFVKQKSARGKLIMPCGTGKSLTAWFLSQELKSKRILIAVPSLSLVKQTLKVWLRESVANNIDVEWICVCSDETAGRADQDDVVVQRQDIAVPCLTSTDKIADWLKAKHKGLTVVFTTYQSGNVLATAARKAKFSFDLGIMDEAHKTVGDEDKQFSILLHDHNVEISKRVFMTATERRYKGSSDKVLSMDNIEVYGDTFHQLSFKQAMEAKKPILCDYNIITIGVSRQEIKELIQKNVFVRPTTGKWDEELEADMLAAMVALRKAMKEHPIKHAVSFHGSIQRAEIFQAHNDTFTKQFPEFGSLETFHVSGQTPTGTRSNIIKNFAHAERSLVTNARCLTEGVDVPGIDCVLFADPRKSTVDIVQAVGRALRPSKGKKLGYVILPVLHDTDATSEQLIESGAFKEVLSTLSALAANDDRIIEYFRGISQGRNPSGSSRVSFEMDERIAERIDIDKLVKDLEIKCWSRLAKLSWRPFEEAREFVRKLGLKTQPEWRDYSKNLIKTLPSRPSDIPSNPNRTYNNSGWVSFGDWLGTGYVPPSMREYLKFEDARSFVHRLNLKNYSEWKDYIDGNRPDLPALPLNIPRFPNQTYDGKGWVGLGDWLGTGYIAASKRVYRSFNESREFVRSLKLRGVKQWYEFCKKGDMEGRKLPKDIPLDPSRRYKKEGWLGWGDWLGTGNIAKYLIKYRSFEEAKKFAIRLNLKSQKEWELWRKNGGKLPADIPANPNLTYAEKGWIGWPDFLNTGVSPRADALPFDEARKIARNLGLKNLKEWQSYSSGKDVIRGNRDLRLPSSPARYYSSSGWSGWGDWLGTGTVSNSKKIKCDITIARRFVHSLRIKTREEWIAFCKNKKNRLILINKGVPIDPASTYKKSGWISMGDWLGTGRIAPQKREFISYEEACKFTHTLKLKTANEWRAYAKGLRTDLPEKPEGIPSSPERVYTDNGWTNWAAWLGT